MPAKPAPDPDPVSEFYWQGAREGVLLVTRCVAHGHLFHPPAPSCPYCGSRELEPAEVSGRGSVYSFTVVRQAFDPAFFDDVPYAIAFVELDEQSGLRLIANLVGIEPEEVEMGMRVEVVFEDRGDHVIPQFRPASTSVGGAAGAST